MISHCIRYLQDSFPQQQIVISTAEAWHITGESNTKNPKLKPFPILDKKCHATHFIPPNEIKIEFQSGFKLSPHYI